MKVELGDGRTVHVKIMHDNYTGFNKGGAPGAAAEAGRVRGKTVAEVTVIGADQSKTTFTGVSFCAPCDNFSRAKGLKCSLARTFKKSTLFSKGDRRAIWGVVTGNKYADKKQGESH